MRYTVIAQLKKQKRSDLLKAIQTGQLGKGSVAGTEYIRDMMHARLLEDDSIKWIEVCFCNPPLAEERPYWEEYFEFKKIEDAVERKLCRHETGTQPWACVHCSCAKQQEENLKKEGKSFFGSLTND